jgi:hypothetical protein
MIFERIRERSDVLFWTGEQILDWYLKERPLTWAPEGTTATLLPSGWTSASS